MSSLSAVQADGYYIPPQYLDSGAYKKKSLNHFVGSKGHNQYLQSSIVRFELPYHGLCLKCQTTIGKGTRFNAYKEHVNNYLSSKIWEFVMKCTSCHDQEFRIRTNPKDRCFDYVSGIKKRVVASNVQPGDGNRESEPIEKSHNSSMAVDGKVEATNALSRLETFVVGERKAITDRDSLETLMKVNSTNLYDDGASNSLLRSQYRSEKKLRKRRLHEAEMRGLGKSIELPDFLPEDTLTARIVFDDEHVISKKTREQEKNAFRVIRTESIFTSEKKKSFHTKSSNLRKNRSGKEIDRTIKNRSKKLALTRREESTPPKKDIGIKLVSSPFPNETHLPERNLASVAPVVEPSTSLQDLCAYQSGDEDGSDDNEKY